MTGRYCWDCARARGRAPEANDFVRMCTRDGNIAVPCDGCTEVVWVDHRGRRVQSTGVGVRDCLEREARSLFSMPRGA